MEKQFEIKVLSGVQAGARASLHGLRVVIGSADDCDIVLSADDVVARHAVLTLGPEGLSIAALEGEVTRADGSLVTDDEPLLPHAPVGLGGSIVAVGEGGVPWPRIDLATFGRRPAAPADDFRPEGEVTPSDVPVRATSDAPVVVDEHPASRQAPTFLSVPSGRQTVYPLIVLLLVGVGFIGFTWFAEGPADAQVAQQTMALADDVAGTEVSDSERVEAALAAGGFGDAIEIRSLRDGAVILTGYVELSRQKEALSQGLGVDGVEIMTRVWAQEDLVKAAERRLVDLDPGLTVSSVGLGVVALGGFLDTPDRRERIVSTVREDVPGLREVRDQMVTPIDAAREVRAAVADSALAGKVQVDVADGTVVARGALGGDGIGIWNTMLADLRNRHGDALPVRTEFVPVISDLPFAIRGIVAGQMRYVMTDGGRRVSEGGDLGGGFRVEAISDGEVTIVGQGQRFVQRFKE